MEDEERAIAELGQFVNRWISNKSKQVTKSPRGLGLIPDPRNRNTETFQWMLLKILRADPDIPESTVIGLYAYVTNTIDELGQRQKEIIVLLSRSSYMLFVEKDNIHSGDFVDRFKEKVLDFAWKYGNKLKATEHLDVLLSKFLKRRLSYSEVEFRWIVFCLVINGKPHMAIAKDGKPFKPEDKFVKNYVHYKKNPTYNYLTYTINRLNDTEREKHIFDFAIEGSSDTEISRFFWTGSRGNCLLFPTQKLIDIVQSNATVPAQFQFIADLGKSNGFVRYIDDDLGKWKHFNTPYPFIEMLSEILSVQEKLWKQAQDGKRLMDLSLEQLTQQAVTEGFVINVHANWRMTPEEISSVPMNSVCANLNADYEIKQFRTFKSGIHNMYLLRAMPAGNVDPNTDHLAFLVATVKNEKEVIIDLFCKNRNIRESKAARLIFPFALKYFAQTFDFILLEALAMAIPFYESYGFIRTPDDDVWVLPVEKSKRSTRRLYDPSIGLKLLK